MFNQMQMNTWRLSMQEDEIQLQQEFMKEMWPSWREKIWQRNKEEVRGFLDGNEYLETSCGLWSYARGRNSVVSGGDVVIVELGEDLEGE